jgi:hypothetical protein
MKTISLIIYQTKDGQIKIETHFKDETVCLIKTNSNAF